MEGLIPMVFKAIKRNQTRRQYRCLSNGASQSYELFYDHADGNHDNVNKHDQSMETRAGFDGGQKGHNRRFGSMGDYEMRSSGYNFNSYGDYEPNNNNININNINGVGRLSTSPPPMHFKRNRSHRIFSCISG